MSGTHERSGGDFVEWTIEGLRAAIERAMYADRVAAGSGLLQPIDPRVKLSGLMALILATALSTRLWVIGAILVVTIVLAALSAISIPKLMLPVWLSTLAFTGTIALPAIFLTPGDPVYTFRALDWSITAQGVTSAGFLILRGAASATIALLLVFTTPWTHILKALRIFRVPLVFVMALGMTFRYILLLLETAHEMFESRKSRTVGRMISSDYRRLAVSSGAALLSKSFHLSNEVFLAMQARGFRGEIHVLDEFHMSQRDWTAAALFATLGVVAMWAGR